MHTGRVFFIFLQFYFNRCYILLNLLPSLPHANVAKDLQRFSVVKSTNMAAIAFVILLLLK